MKNKEIVRFANWWLGKFSNNWTIEKQHEFYNTINDENLKCIKVVLVRPDFSCLIVDVKDVVTMKKDFYKVVAVY